MFGTSKNKNNKEPGEKNPPNSDAESQNTSEDTPIHDTSANQSSSDSSENTTSGFSSKIGTSKTILPWILFGISSVLAIGAMIGLFMVFINSNNELFQKDQAINELKVEMDKQKQVVKENKLTIIKGMGNLLGTLIGFIWQDAFEEKGVIWEHLPIQDIVQTTELLYIHFLDEGNIVRKTSDLALKGQSSAESISQAKAEQAPVLRELTDRVGYELIIPVFGSSIAGNRYLGAIKLGFHEGKWKDNHGK